ncbi:MAG: hypothetical protein AAFR56_11585 [Chloroflexota bacterium]
MGISVRWWDDSETILIYTFVSPWTVEDIYSVFAVSDGLVDNAGTFSIVFDVSKGLRFPPDLLSAVDFLRQRARNDVHVRVFVGDQKYPRMFVNIIRQFVPQLKQNVYFVDNVEEAVCLIHRTDSAC